jgi:hypothetical protein
MLRILDGKACLFTAVRHGIGLYYAEPRSRILTPILKRTQAVGGVRRDPARGGRILTRVELSQYVLKGEKYALARP